MITAVLAVTAGAGPVTAQDTTGDAIIRAAIARKHADVSAPHDYLYDVATRFLVRDADKPADSATAIAQISETRGMAEWQAPDHYYETITARRRVNHLTQVWATISIADIGNFQRGRIEISPHALVSPVGDDALSYYHYRVQDTLAVNGVRILRLEVVPQSQAMAGFAGVIDIRDSTWEVVAMDLGVNAAVRFGLWKSIRYQQRNQDVGDGHWLPSEIQLTGEARLPVPVPRTPRDLAFEQQARFSAFRFDVIQRSREMREVRTVIADGADQADSTIWLAPGAIPLVDAERPLWEHVDSVSRRSPGFIQQIEQVGRLGQWVTASPDFFHFNRVDGAYVGAGFAWRQSLALSLHAKLGYATGSDRGQYRFGGAVQLSESERSWLGLSWYDETISRPSLGGGVMDRTIPALLYRQDPLDYYRERGVTLSFATRPIDFTQFTFTYNDQQQDNLANVTDYSLFHSRELPRANGPITAGRMRTLSGEFSWDSRSLLRSNGRDARLTGLTWTRVTLSAEVAAPSVIPDDFSFSRFVIQFERHQRIFRSGITTVSLLGGIGLGTVPPQRYFTIDAGVRALGFQGSGFHTLGDSSYAGNRIAMLSIRHDFDQLLFAESGLPLLRRLPFTLSIYAATFDIRFAYHDPVPGDSVFRATTTPYVEAGFVLGNLLPFVRPLNVGAQFTWQLSAQSERRFQFGLDLRGP